MSKTDKAFMIVPKTESSPFALSPRVRGGPFMVRQAHHERHRHTDLHDSMMSSHLESNKLGTF